MRQLILLLILSALFPFQSYSQSETNKPYVGIYSWINAARFRVYEQHDTKDLMISISEEGIFKLTRLGDDRFGIDGLDDHTISFKKEKGTAKAIRWELANGKVFEGKRIKKLDKYAVDVYSQLSYQVRSDHFMVLSTPSDSAEAARTLNILDSAYIPLTSKYELEDLPIVRVKIYPTKTDYSIGINLPDRQGSLLTATEFGRKTIAMISTSTLKNETYYETVKDRGVLHEFIHVLHRNIDNNAFNTGWLYEGMAIYLSGCCHDDQPEDISYFQKRKHLTFKKINSDPFFKKKYQAGPFIVEFIDQTYGWDYVLELVRNNGDIGKTFNRVPREIEMEFYAYLEKRYL